MKTASFLVLQLLTAQAAEPDTATLERTAAVESARLAESPDDADALYRLGTAFLALNTPKKAVAPLKKLVAQEPDLIPPKLALARALRLSGEPEQARTVLDTAIAAFPEESTLRAERGLLARVLDERDVAISQYAVAVELSPRTRSCASTWARHCSAPAARTTPSRPTVRR